MKKSDSLKKKIMRFVLPLIFIPLIITGGIGFLMQYKDAKIKLFNFMTLREKEIVDFSASTNIEDYFISKKFHLEEEANYYAFKISEEFQEVIRFINMLEQVYLSIQLIEHTGKVIAQISTGESIPNLNTRTYQDVWKSAEKLPVSQISRVRHENTMIFAMPIYFRNESNPSAILISEFLYPARLFRNTIWIAFTSGILILISCSVAYLLTTKWIHRTTSPLITLEQAARKISEGNLDFPVIIESQDEIGRLAQSFGNMVMHLKESQEHIHQQISHLKALSETSLKISSELDIDKLHGIITEAAFSIATIQTMQILLKNQEEFFIYHDSSCGGKAERKQYPIPLKPNEQKFVQSFVTLREPLFMERQDPRRQKLSFDFLKKEKEHYFFGYPLISGENILGAVLGLSKFSRPFAQEELSLVNALFSHIATAYNNALLYNDLLETNARLTQAMTDLEQAQRYLIQTEKMSALGEMISGVAHELNNPMQVISLSASFLSQKIKQPEEVKQFISDIENAVSRCKKIISNLLLFSRARPPEEKPASINKIITSTLDLISYQLKSDNIQVELELEEELPETLVDFQQIQQVILNLMNNAHHAMLGVSKKRILKIKSFKDNGNLKIQISDSGAGIPENIVSKIFDPFFTTKEIGKGTGLGLSVVYKIIQNHGGSIEVESKENIGTCMTVSLPICIFNPEAPAQGSDFENKEVQEKRPGKKLLIVDDEKQIVSLLSRYFNRLGYEIDTALEGKEALGKALEYKFDVILCDMKMPGMDGMTFYKRLASTSKEYAKCVIFLTGDIISPETKNFLTQRNNKYLQKPVDLEELNKLLVEVIDAQ